MQSTSPKRPRKCMLSIWKPLEGRTGVSVGLLHPTISRGRFSIRRTEVLRDYWRMEGNLEHVLSLGLAQTTADVRRPYSSTIRTDTQTTRRKKLHPNPSVFSKTSHYIQVASFSEDSPYHLRWRQTSHIMEDGETGD